MTLEAQATQLREGAIGPTVVPLLAVAVFINYVDRGNLATAAPLDWETVTGACDAMARNSARV
jgi:hypothetical protein